MSEEVLFEDARVRLRPMRPGDAPLIESLRTGAGHPEIGGDTLVITRTGEDFPIGMLDYRVDDPASATIAWIALTEGARRWGLGVDAVLLFEEEACRSWGVRQFRTEVNGRQGLSLYFWLRLGYRPTESRRDQGGIEAIAMVRDVETP